MLLVEPKQENILAEMESLNHNLGQYILMGKKDESHYKEIISIISAFAGCCESLLKGEWRFIGNEEEASNKCKYGRASSSRTI